MKYAKRLLRIAFVTILGIASVSVYAERDAVWGKARLGATAFAGQLDDGQAPLSGLSATHLDGPRGPLAQVAAQPMSEAELFAVADLARRLDVDPSVIAVLSTTAVMWSDSSVGCPELGMAYMQVLTPGQRIRLSADGRVYEYHSSRTGMPRYCETPELPVGDGSGIDAPSRILEPILIPEAPTE